MAHTARDDEDKREFFDSPEELDRKVTLLAQWVRESKHTIVFTGAGVSTAAGIPDFRSGMSTSLNTGPGVWELQAKGQLRDTKHRVTSTTRAIPTPTHMTFVKLQQEGLLKCVISQNCDGLHRRSGMPRDALFELHGNSNVERCDKCDREYLRDYRVRVAPGVHDHFTGKRCDDPSCGGYLMDTIINFGESLPTETLETSFDHAQKAELCLAMGSSLTVTPAAEVPQTVGERQQRLVIVNLQRTPLDPVARLRIFAKCDDVSKLLMSKLVLTIPEFRLKRKIIFVAEQTDRGQIKVEAQGADAEGHPFSFLKEVFFQVGDTLHPVRREPFVHLVKCEEKETVEVTMTVGFHAHYGEPGLVQALSISKSQGVRVVASLEYNPFTREWAVSRSDQGGASQSP